MKPVLAFKMQDHQQQKHQSFQTYRRTDQDSDINLVGARLVSSTPIDPFTQSFNDLRQLTNSLISLCWRNCKAKRIGRG